MRRTRTYPIILIVEIMIIGLLALQFSPYSSYIHTNNLGFSEANYSDNIFGIVPVFATTDDRVRCSDGKLVGSPGECPATDQCPPPQNNTISNCVPGETLSGEPAEFVDQNLTSNITTSDTGSESENTTNRCFEDRSTPHTPRCED
jgi:hypothetical protein